MPPCLYMPLCLPLCFVCHRLSNLCTTRFHVHNLSISRRVSATFIHRSRLWAWGHHPSTHKIAPNTSFSTPKLPFLSKSDVWPAHYDPAPIWAADDGLINLFPLPSSKIDFFSPLILHQLSLSLSETRRAPVTPSRPLQHPSILQDWLFVIITPDLSFSFPYSTRSYYTRSSKIITPDLLPPPLFPFSICPQFVSVCPAAGKKLNESPSQHTTEYDHCYLCCSLPWWWWWWWWW